MLRSAAMTHPPLTLAGIGGLGPWELGLILLIVLIIFGAGKLPTIGSSIGQAIKNFRKGVKSPDEEKEDEEKK